MDLYYIEFDEECAKKWASKTTGATIFTGDQGNKEFLQDFVKKSGGNFDIIVEDGGHYMKQQIVSLNELWPAIKPGGMYFVEDTLTSYQAAYGGDETGGRDHTIPTFMRFAHEVIDDVMFWNSKHAISADVRGVDCQRHICNFIKKELGTV